MRRALWLLLAIYLVVLTGSSPRAEAAPVLRVDGPRATVVDDPSVAPSGALSRPTPSPGRHQPRARELLT